MKMQKGFSLVELMIVVVIIGILASVALPSYSNYVRRGKIAEATSSLSAARVSMEQYYQDNRTYLNGAACGAVMPAFQYFTLTCAGTANPDTYTITATAPGAPLPPNGTRDNSMAGFAYTVNNLNAKASVITGAAAAAGWASNAACWTTKPGGAC